MGVDVYGDPDKVDPFKWMNVTVKAAPKKGCVSSNTFIKAKEQIRYTANLFEFATYQ